MMWFRPSIGTFSGYEIHEPFETGNNSETRIEFAKSIYREAIFDFKKYHLNF